MQRLLGMLLAAAAAYGYHRYSKMTPEQKADLKRRGKDFLDKNLSGVNGMFGKKSTTAQAENMAPPY